MCTHVVAVLFTWSLVAATVNTAIAQTPSMPILSPFSPPPTSALSTSKKVFAYPAASSQTVGDFASPQIIGWLTNLIRENLPEDYEDTRKWGHQKEVWDGIELRREDGRIETKRRKKLVNSGTWTKYHVAFVEPEKHLHIEFHQLQSNPAGGIDFSVSVEGLLDVHGRMSQWLRDVQLVSISVDADAVVKLTMSGTVLFKLNPLKLPPDVIIRPKVEQAVVELSYFRVRRVSQIGGDFAKVLGEGARGTVDRKIDETNAKLVDKMNKQIEKQHDKMILSLQDWLQSKLPSPQKP
jgi:hypothetical protein